MRAALYRRGKARHYIRCVTTTRLERKQTQRFRRYRAWRRSYQGWWQIQAMRTPYHQTLSGLRFCESTNNYQAHNGQYHGAYQFADSTWARAQWWVPSQYRTWRASAASVDHQDVVTGRFYYSHSGEWSCSN